MAGKLWRLIILREGVLAILCFERVDVNGSIGGLGRDVFIEGIPSYTLDVVAMLGDLSNKGSCTRRQNVDSYIPRRWPLTCVGAIDSSNVVHATNDKVVAVRGPGEVVDLGTAGTAHVFCPP
jgi:hypothetical protein